MTFSEKFLYTIFLLLGLTLGLTVSKIYQNIPFFDWESDVDVISLVSLIVTVIIAFLVPFTLKKIIDDNRNVKNALVEEIKLLIDILNRIKGIIVECHERGNITSQDKDKINYIFHEADLQLLSLREQMNIAFNSKLKEVIKCFTDLYFEYNNVLTGGPLMTSKFTTIDDQFRRQHDTHLSNYITHLKKLVHQIHKF